MINMTTEKTLHFENQERWQFTQIDKKKIDEISKQYDLDPLLAKLILLRKLDQHDYIKIEDFLNPPESLLTKTDGITTEEQLKIALTRLKLARKNKEKVLVNGDPDADGITGAAVLVIGLRELGFNVSYDFPTRCTEGHGIHPRIIDDAKEAGVNLVLSVDCGTREVKSIDYANEQGIDVIVCDHHRVGKILPAAHAIINPYLVKEANDMQVLSGSGIGFKLIIALYEFMGQELSESLLHDLAGITSLGTISDRMSLLSPQNRLIVKRGIAAINKTKKEGLKALKTVCTHNDSPIKPRDIARTIVPRLNAPGRIGNKAEGIPDSSIVIDLLLIGSGKKNKHKASKVFDKFTQVFEKSREKPKESTEENTERKAALTEASVVEDINEQRKLITSKIEDEIDYLIESQVDVENDKLIIVQGKDWNPGVIGIDTDRLKERFLRPSIILTEYEDSDYIRGSSRSIPTINIYQIIENASDAFEKEHGRKLFMTEAKTSHGTQLINAFGGHAQACGFSVHRKDVEAFKTFVMKEMETVPAKSFEYHYEILETLTFSDINDKLLMKLDTLSPYGQHFDFPTFYLKRCHISRMRAFGNKYQEARTPHADFIVSNPALKKKNSAKDRIEGVGFGLFEKLSRFRAEYGSDALFDIIFSVEISTRRRKRQHQNLSSFRFNVLDVRLSKEQ